MCCLLMEKLFLEQEEFGAQELGPKEKEQTEGYVIDVAMTWHGA